ncbi:MAG: Glycine cleavage system H protein [Phycisphaerae bacterium]|nr:Glycine cleavage system H protein [Phycisphaerae bacterium]
MTALRRRGRRAGAEHPQGRQQEMSIPTDRRYLPSHEWFKLEGSTVVMGITQFAADELTDITFVSLPKVGASFKAGGVIGEVESVKATSEIFTGVSGEVVEVNAGLNHHPESVNDDAFGRGWMIKLKASNPAELNALLTAEQYGAKIA